MAQTAATIVLAFVSAIATGVAVGSGGGSGDIAEIAAGCAVFTGLMAITTPLLAAQHKQGG